MGVILITGGAGFIGGNLVRLLAASGRRIRVLDNFSTGKAPDLSGMPLELVAGDIRNPGDVDAAMANSRTVVHLAAHTGVLDSVTDPETNMDINVRGTLNLLQAAVRHGVERFIFASTGGAIVGEVEPPVHENMLPRPISPYGASKLAGEGYCSAFWGSYGLKTISLRFTNAFGPYSYHKGSVIAKFCRKILAGEELIIYGDGEQTRDFVYAGDLCDGIVTAIDADLPYGQAIQLGTGIETSLNELVALLKEVVKPLSFPPVKYSPAQPGEVMRNFVSIARAQKYLNFNPQVSLKAGLQRTWDWFHKISITSEM
jgi:UDP-glucose 4-epimerase